MDDDRDRPDAHESSRAAQPPPPEALARERNVQFEGLFRRHYKAAVSFLLRHGFDREDARDYAQEAFIRVFDNMGSFRGKTPEAEAAYICIAALNVGRNAVRGAKTKKRSANTVSFSTLVSPENLATRDVWTGLGPSTGDEDLQLNETAQRLSVAIQELPETLREPLLLRIADASYQEIAGALSLKVETVKSYLTKARHRLRELLAEEPAGIEWPKEPPEDAP
jgi:RNA polymerase sigma-70 factor (ECF subfamily)